jgi:hypothetical protein
LHCHKNRANVSAWKGAPAENARTAAICGYFFAYRINDMIWKNDMGTNPMPMKPKNKGKTGKKGGKGC